MSGVDDELERLKRRRMLELQRRLHRSESKPEAEVEKPKEPSPDEVLGRQDHRAEDQGEVVALRS